jgi:hypothetical protein
MLAHRAIGMPLGLAIMNMPLIFCWLRCGRTMDVTHFLKVWAFSVRLVKISL